MMGLPKITNEQYRLGLDKLDIENLNSDLETIYNRVKTYLDSKEKVQHSDLSFMNFIFKVKQDKEETIKFLMNYDLKLKELGIKTEVKENPKGTVIND